MPTCSVENCANSSRTLGLCNKHAIRFKKYGHTGDTPRAQAPVEFRLWRRVDKRGPDDCWNWTGKNSLGYGQIQMGGKGSPVELVHRLSYMMHHGPIADGMVVMHKCDNPSCVNPAHLKVGTYAENTADMIRKGRKRTAAVVGEKCGGAVLTEDLVRRIRTELHKNNHRMALELGVGVNTVRAVRIGKTWRHVRP